MSAFGDFCLMHCSIMVCCRRLLLNGGSRPRTVTRGGTVERQLSGASFSHDLRDCALPDAHMQYWVAITDQDWFTQLSALQSDDVNFWQPKRCLLPCKSHALEVRTVGT
jgi:hypothetical protein